MNKYDLRAEFKHETKTKIVDEATYAMWLEKRLIDTHTKANKKSEIYTDFESFKKNDSKMRINRIPEKLPVVNTLHRHEGLEPAYKNFHIKEISIKAPSVEPIHMNCTSCGEPIDYDKLLSTIGPEGMYDVARKFMELADDDMSTALKQCDGMYP
jgi:hypothetical protein